MNPLLKKEELVRYIIYKYKAEFGKEISNIKLQFCLYFLYAMWGGKVLAVKDDENYEPYSTFNLYLFDAKFEAWKFGPIDKTVWEKYELGEYNE